MNKKIKVLHIITKLELGGAQENTLYTVKNLDKNKYEVFLIAGNKGFLVSEAKKIKGVKVYLLSCLKREISFLLDLLAFFKIKQIIKKEKIDIVHTHCSKAGILGRLSAKFAHTPLIIHTIHGFGFHSYQFCLVQKFYIFLEKIIAKFTDKLIAVSYCNVDKGLKYQIGNKDQYEVIHSGIKINNFLQSKIDLEKKKKEIGLLLNSPIIGMIACFKPQKAPLDFVKMASIVQKKIENVQFVLVGDGILKDQIKNLIKEFNLDNNFILTGWRQDIPELMQIFDIFVLTSLWEGLPRVFLESFACKKPIVATCVDGAEEVIKNGYNGFLVNPGDYEKMAFWVIQLLENFDKRKQIGENGFKTLFSSSDFDINGMVKKIEKLYLDQVKLKKI